MRGQAVKRLNRLVTGVLLALATAAAPGVVHADAAGPTDWRSEVVSVSGGALAELIEVSIEGGDAFVRIAVRPGHTVTVLGYDGEPYLWIDPAGTVYENRRSYATYYNRTRDGSGEIPAGVDPQAAPVWEQIGAGGAWAWHDHRAHWMGDEPPAGMEPGDSLPPTIVPLEVDGTRVEITVVTRLVATPSWWPSVAGAAVGAVLVAFALTAGWRLDGMAIVVLAGAAVAIGAAQYVSLPSETGPRPVWWLLPAVSLVCGVALAARRRWASVVGLGLTAVAASELVVWAMIRRGTLTSGVLPTDAPFWLDRAVTAACASGGIALLAATLTRSARLLRQDVRTVAFAWPGRPSDR